MADDAAQSIGSPFEQEDPDDDSWVGRVMEAMLITKALNDTGGIIRVSRRKVDEAMDKARRWFPNGMHAHWSSSPEAFELELVDRSRCEKQGHPEPEGATARDVGSAWGTEDVVRIDPSTGNPMGGRITEDELVRVNHAQHVLLTVALSRLGTPSIEVTKAEYEAVTSVHLTGLSALIISRRGDSVYASLVDDIKGGTA